MIEKVLGQLYLGHIEWVLQEHIQLILQHPGVGSSIASPWVHAAAFVLLAIFSEEL